MRILILTLGFAEFGTSTQNKQFLNNFARFLSGHFQIWEIVNRNRRFAFCWNVIQFYISLFWLHFGSFRECSERGTKFYFPANSSKTNYIIDRFAVRPNGDLVGKQQNNLNGRQVILSWLLKSTTFPSKNLLSSKKFTWLTCWPCGWERYLLTKIMATIFGLLPYDQAAMLVVNPPKFSFYRTFLKIKLPSQVREILLSSFSSPLKRDSANNVRISSFVERAC